MWGFLQEEAKTVVFTKSDSKPFEDYKRNDTPFYNKQYGIRFETEKMFKDTEHTLEWNCPACEETLSNMKDLKAHVKQTHQRQLW